MTALHRAKQLLLAHRSALPWLLYALSLAAFLLLPLASRNVSSDEKALLLGTRPPAVRVSSWPQRVHQLYQQLQPAAASATEGSPWADVPTLLHAAAAALPSAAPAAAPTPTLPPIHTIPAPSGNCSTAQLVAKAPRGDGLEALALLLPVRLSQPQQAALAAGVGLAAAAHVGAQPWLAKGVVVAFVDAECFGGNAGEAVQAWLDSYHGVGPGAEAFPPEGRAGLLQQALVLDLVSPSLHPAALSVQGYSGQLPNLDMYWAALRNWDQHGGAPVRLAQRDLSGLAARLAGWQRGSVGRAGPATGKGSGGASRWYAAELLHSAVFALQQAAGVTAATGQAGPHAALLAAGIDAVTITVGASSSPMGTVAGAAGTAGGADSPQQQAAAIAGVLAYLEALLRMLSNLEERLHHASTLYLLAAHDRVVGLGPLLAAPGVALAALLFQFWLELEGAPSAANSQAWRRGWAAAATLHAAVLMPCAAWLFWRDSGGRQPLASEASAPAAAGGWTWAGSAALGALVLWRWAAALQQALFPPEQPAEQLPAVVGAPPSSKNGCAGGGHAAGAQGLASPLAAAISMGAGSGLAQREEWIRCIRLTTLTGLAVAGAALVMCHWSLCYALLLAALPCLMATQSSLGRVQQPQRQQAATASSAAAAASSAAATARRGSGTACIMPFLKVLLGAVPAGLLAWAAYGVLGAGWLSRLEPAAALAAAQWLACFLTAAVSAAVL